MVALNLMICPYLSTESYVFNDLGYFSNVLSGVSFYSLQMLVVLLIIPAFLILVKKQNSEFLSWIFWPRCGLYSFTSGVFFWR